MFKNFFLEFKNEWTQLVGKYNWYTVTFIQIEFENDLFTGGYEFVFILLGLGFRLRYNTKKFYELEAQWQKETDEAVDEMNRENVGMTLKDLKKMWEE
jgi:hypothetical protein